MNEIILTLNFNRKQYVQNKKSTYAQIHIFLQRGKSTWNEDQWAKGYLQQN